MDVDKVEEKLLQAEEKLNPLLDKAVDAIEPHVGDLADKVYDAFWDFLEGYKRAKEKPDDGPVS